MLPGGRPLPVAFRANLVNVLQEVFPALAEQVRRLSDEQFRRLHGELTRRKRGSA